MWGRPYVADRCFLKWTLAATGFAGRYAVSFLQGPCVVRRKFSMALIFQLGLVVNSCIAQQSNLDSYTLTRDQIVAIRDLSDHGSLTFVWDWKPNDPWNWHDE